MIIRFPTGLYATELPGDTDVGNVTYTISNRTPPRTNLLFPKIPVVVIGQSRDKRPRSLLPRRVVLGELAFSVAKANRVELGNSEKVYATGQILEFDNRETRTIDPMLVPNKMEIVHNDTLINYAGLDIKPDAINAIEANAIKTYERLRGQLNDVIEDRKKSEELVLSYQKIVNDAEKAIKALTIVNSIEYDQGINQIILKTQAKKMQALKDIETTTVKANQQAAKAKGIQDQIREVAAVIK